MEPGTPCTLLILTGIGEESGKTHRPDEGKRGRGSLGACAQSLHIAVISLNLCGKVRVELDNHLAGLYNRSVIALPGDFRSYGTLKLGWLLLLGNRLLGFKRITSRESKAGKEKK